MQLNYSIIFILEISLNIEQLLCSFCEIVTYLCKFLKKVFL